MQTWSLQRKKKRSTWRLLRMREMAFSNFVLNSTEIKLMSVMCVRSFGAEMRVPKVKSTTNPISRPIKSSGKKKSKALKSRQLKCGSYSNQRRYETHIRINSQNKVDSKRRGVVRLEAEETGAGGGAE